MSIQPEEYSTAAEIDHDRADRMLMECGCISAELDGQLESVAQSIDQHRDYLLEQLPMLTSRVEMPPIEQDIREACENLLRCFEIRARIHSQMGIIYRLTEVASGER